MNRLSDAWFEFKGISSKNMGIKMLEMPKRSVAYLKGKYRQVAGMDGNYFLTDGTYENAEISFSFDLVDRSKGAQVDAWLAGIGTLRFSDEPDRQYVKAVLGRASNRRNTTKHLDGQTYSVVFTAHPFKRSYPEPEEREIYESGTTINNPGTAPSEPRIKITGSGDFSLTIGMETMFFSGVSDGGIIVDTELKDALTYDGTLLATDNASGDFIRIQPGTNVVSWLVEEGEGNEVTGITILPRWRWK